MGRKKWDSAIRNERTFIMYYQRLTELAMNMFEWKNLPDTCDVRFLEMCLNSEGMAIFFKDEVMGYLTLQTMIGGNLDVYRIPKIRTAYAVNGYRNQLNETNSIIIFNNYLHTNNVLDLQIYAERLYEIERTIDTNVKAQKTPILLQCDENLRLTMKNLYMQYDGNEPFIFGDKRLTPDSLQAINTAAPFVADKLQILKRQVWNEALTFLGIENSNTEKRERLVSDEVTTNLGGVEAQRYARLNSRRDAAKKINEMFGLNIEVNFRDFGKLIEVSRETFNTERRDKYDSLRESNIA